MSNAIGSFTQRRRSIVGRIFLVILCLSARAGAETIVIGMAAVPQSMPLTIQISPELRPRVEAMLQASPTFRQQFERIAGASKLIVTARLDGSFVDKAFRARSTIRRYDSGLLVVAVDIGPGSRQAEWIAHEFEHVLEQLDGLNLPNLASHGRADTWYSSAAMIETARAVRAGRAVVEEMSGRKDAQTSLWSR